MAVNPFAPMVPGVPGSTLERGKGYHDLPFPEYEGAPSHRKDTAARIAHLTRLTDFRDLRGIDIGCSTGGIAFGLQQAGALMLGIDADPQAIEVARSVEAAQQTGARFLHGTVPSPWFTRRLREGWDFGIWLSSWMWVAKGHGRAAALKALAEVAAACPVLFFESAAGPDDGIAGDVFRDQAEVAQVLRACYSEVVDTGTAGEWFRRRIYLCRA